MCKCVTFSDVRPTLLCRRNRASVPHQETESPPTSESHHLHHADSSHSSHTQEDPSYFEENEPYVHESFVLYGFTFSITSMSVCTSAHNIYVSAYTYDTHYIRIKIRRHNTYNTYTPHTTYIYTYAYIHTHKYIHTYTYIRIHTYI